jgi:RNA polymerase sigma-70 factor (ECF subfamily)
MGPGFAVNDSRAASLVAPPPPKGAADDPDARVAELAAAGRAEQALELLVATHGDGVFGYCRRMLGGDAEGDDVSQIVFVQAYEALRGGTRVAAPRAWLYGIARHRCLDRLKARRRAPLPVADAALARAIDADGTAAPGELRDPRAARALDECLDRLDPRSRAVLVLRFHDELDYEAISELTGDRPGALRVRVSRALPALRACLEGKGVAS